MNADERRRLYINGYIIGDWTLWKIDQAIVVGLFHANGMGVGEERGGARACYRAREIIRKR